MHHDRKAQQHEKVVKFLAIAVLPAGFQKQGQPRRHAQDIALSAREPARHEHNQHTVAQQKQHFQHIYARRALHGHLRERHHQKEQRALVFDDVDVGGQPLRDAAAHAQKEGAICAGASVQRVRAGKRGQSPEQSGRQADSLGQQVSAAFRKHAFLLLCMCSQVDPR